ncbi:hypothetical protein [Pedobacter antarcticus]|uniref:hypothetical protein n=1 Tax=Pedobacter antarcticus TaxID=34086 RepID=UPI00292FB1FC|nr:hypothetical protein [Pedobacter antarcticus]
MKLVKCDVCTAMNSPLAEVCKGCNHPVGRLRKEKIAAKNLLYLLLLGIIVMTIVYYLKESDQLQPYFNKLLGPKAN